MLALLGLCAAGHAQAEYAYSVDLNKVHNDQLSIELITPAIKSREAIFHLPKIVPGTYMYSNYGRFVHNLKAFNKAGKELSVMQPDSNSWKIGDAPSLARISYEVEDTWDSSVSSDVYAMAGSNIEEGKNFVLNTFAMFGYFEGMKKLPLRLTVQKPAAFFGSTAMQPLSSSPSTDVFSCRDIDQFYDSPLMYCRPDTTMVRVANTKVMVSVYSPKQKVSSRFLAQNLEKALMGTKDYLGGKLPVDHYAFIYYFNGEQPPLLNTGALEHSYSSFYALPETPQEQFIQGIVDMSSHEFFHIVTPLTIGSELIKDFDFNKPELSEHLWLYEGSTEYDAHHMQVVSGLITPQEFLKRLSQKITVSRSHFKDDLSFFELSRQSAGAYKDQYNNVYLKGALISTCLDLYLLHLSGGRYSLRDLKHDLSVRYGEQVPFKEEQLVADITTLTYPEIEGFFKTYVQGGTPIPYAYYFDMAGVKYSPKSSTMGFTLGGFVPGLNDSKRLFVSNTDKMNEFGKKMGYRQGDELLKLNGKDIIPETFQAQLQELYAGVKEGEPVSVTVGREENGRKETLTLSAPAMKVEKTEENKLEMMDNASAAQWQVRRAWLGIQAPMEASPGSIKADPKDVSDINALVGALYDVISGPAGPRNWDRFKSLFYPGAKMGAMHASPKGLSLSQFSPDEYVHNNAPLFRQFAFMEQEIGREVHEYGQIAQVFTAYQFKLMTPQPMEERGINSLQLIKEGGRWWIVDITWQEETKDNPIPKTYLASPQKKQSKE